MAPAKRNGGRRGRTRRRRGLRWLAAALFPVILAALALAAPSVADGYTALQWTRHYAAGGGTGERPVERGRQAGRWAARAVDTFAPLPQAVEAASLALRVGSDLAREHPAAAVALAAQVRPALERQRASSWRGWGLGSLADAARALEAASETPRPPARAPRPADAPRATAASSTPATGASPAAGVPAPSPDATAAPVEAHVAPTPAAPSIQASPSEPPRRPSPDARPSAASPGPSAPTPSRRATPQPRPSGAQP